MFQCEEEVEVKQVVDVRSLDFFLGVMGVMDDFRQKCDKVRDVLQSFFGCNMVKGMQGSQMRSNKISGRVVVGVQVRNGGNNE